MTVVCLAASAVRPSAPPSAPVPLLLPWKATPQNVCIPSMPPSMPTAPALPPLPTWCWLVFATTEHFVASSLLAPKPSAALPSKRELYTSRSELSDPMAPLFDPEFPVNVEPTTTAFSAPDR